MDDKAIFKRYTSGDKAVMGEIYKQYDPLIGKTVLQYKDSGIPPDVLTIQAKSQLNKAMKSYDPTKGPLTPHLQNSLQSMYRETNKASKMYIPDARASLYRKYQDTYGQLQEQLKRPPTNVELADTLKIGVKDINRLAKETKVKIVPDNAYLDAGDYEGDTFGSPEALAGFVKDRLDDPVDVQILDMSMAGRKGMSNVAIAKKLGLSESAVRQRKDKIIKMIRDVS